MRTCPDKINSCECDDDPVGNFSSEDPDPQLFCVTVKTVPPPSLGKCSGGGELSNLVECCSKESYMDAYLCALRMGNEGVWGTWKGGTCPPPGCPPDCPPGCPPICPPPGCPPNCPLYGNAEQTCTQSCADGSQFSFTVPALTFYAVTQADADSLAYQVACANVTTLCGGDGLFYNTDQSCTVVCADLSTQTWTVPAGLFVSRVDQADADGLAYALACANANVLCAGGTLYYNTAQTCSQSCTDGATSTWTVAAGMVVSNVSQATADGVAYGIACSNVAIICNDGGTLYFNVAQSCTQSCPDGSSNTGTTPAGLVISSISQADADGLAYTFACQSAVLICRDVKLYYNHAQACTVDCPAGGTFTYTVGAGKIVALTQSEADFQASNLACRLAKLVKICITTSTLAGTCVGASYSVTLKATGGTPWVITGDNYGSPNIPGECFSEGVTIGSVFPYVWTVVAGALPTGLTLHPCSGVINGTPTADGVYAFTVRATDATGAYQERNLSICAVAILTDSPLPDATLGTNYTQVFSENPGNIATEKWTLFSGELPPGLTLETTTGILHGTPTGPAQTYHPVIQVEVDCP